MQVTLAQHLSRLGGYPPFTSLRNLGVGDLPHYFPKHHDPDNVRDLATMDDRAYRYSTTSNVLAWTAHTAKLEPSIEEEAADTDEPPDSYETMSPLSDQFRRTSLRRGSEQHESLLTKALQSHSDDDQPETTSALNCRRRSMTSTTSFASTTDMTCDTGITTPARTSTPSPRLVDAPFTHHVVKHTTVQTAGTNPGEKDPAVQALEKKRCISFACAAKPRSDAKPELPKPTVTVTKPAEQAPPRRTCIKFACPTSKPAKCTPPEHVEEAVAATPIATPAQRKETPSTAVKHRSPSTPRLTPRPLNPRRSSRSPAAVRTSKRWLTADSMDLDSECSRYHAFASEEVEEDDWIRRDQKSGSGRITIDDTLKKENAIRKLGEEVEEEEELEEQLDDEADIQDEDDQGEDDEDDADEDGPDAEYDDDQSADGTTADGGSDGYNTDNEVGFAESDESDDDLDLWTTGLVVNQLTLSGATPVRRRSSLVGEIHSDSSVYGNNNKRRTRARRVPRADTPELPDSTDFVCGTLDEDKPLEEAYVSRVMARRKEKLHPIPQDIDPSFPTSEPEDEAEDLYNHGHHGSDDQMFGEMEELSDGVDRKKRHHKNVSPKRYHSPPPKRQHSPAPKRHHSPAPKARGRSPRRLFDGQSPRRLRSPPPQVVSRSPAASPVVAGQGIGFKPLAARPGLVFTKSLPRTPAVFGAVKARRGRSGTITQENHVRGAIDIVKGLEQKRQRRKEKFYQKYCTRARKNPAQTKRPVPGQGAQRMREVGLTMAGKMGQGNFVLSV